ncbi:MAG TPA: undecaprenyl-phosphate glucose phosphotransferase [Myxococcaceae bacterium]|nr:undecaprenyl-phosphate glucose phosphotransferase [Myxococcaceae bacterium]
MFSRFQRFYTSIKVLMDLGMIALAFALSFSLRFFVLEGEALPPWEDTLFTVAAALVIFPTLFHQSRLYTTNRTRSGGRELFELFKGVAFGTLLVVGVTYFFRERYSRLTLGLFATSSFVLVAGMRMAMRAVLSHARRRGLNMKSILVVGAGDLAARVVGAVEAHRELGFKVVGLLSHHPIKVGTKIGGAPVVGLIAEAERYLDRNHVDQVIIALPIEEHRLIKRLMEQLALRTVDVKVVPDVTQYVTLYGGIEEFGGLPLVSLQGAPLDGWNPILKRLFDVIFATVALLIAAPVMLVTALLVKLTSRGPIFYAQERMGMDGRTFRILKFRTMRVDAEAGGAQMASAQDDRRTVIGTFLRRTSIDELPQLFNVLVGDMSLVGPRPERPVFIEAFKKQIPRYHLRHKVKAGITGWAQVNGLRGQTSIEKRIEYDLYYIQNWSLGLDFKILVKTALGGFLSKNAY